MTTAVPSADRVSTPVPGAGEACAHDLFEASATAHPALQAVSLAGAGVCYAALDRRADAVAARLRALGVGPDVRVGVLVERGPELAAALLGVWKAGGAYVPLDAEYPPERVAWMLEDAGAAAVLTSASLRGRLSGIAAPVIDVASIPAELADAFEPVRVPADALAYVIYTSGSTGRPKGVGISHRSLVAHNRAVISLFDLTPDDRAAQVASLGFDISVEEMFPTWAAGGTVVFRPADVPTLGPGFAKWVEDEGITILNLPTALWHAWVAEMGDDAVLPPSLRLVVVGGEKAQATAFAAWRRIAGPRVRWMNSYGPTEATVTATSWGPLPPAPLPQNCLGEGGEAAAFRRGDGGTEGSKSPLDELGAMGLGARPTDRALPGSLRLATPPVPGGAEAEAAAQGGEIGASAAGANGGGIWDVLPDGDVPIGWPVGEARCLVLDGLDAVPEGEAGELCIGGPGVARGYLGRPGLTAEHFIPDPSSTVAGARMYRTGDRVRWIADGQPRASRVVSREGRRTSALPHSRTCVLQFLGRLDAQVKVAGFRVEPGEVEAALGEHPEVAQAAVVARDDGAGRTRLVAYAVMHADAPADEAALRGWLAARLPAYMVPAAVVRLDAMPLTAHGKVDRRALPAPAELAPVDDAGPAGETERAVREAWREVLGAPRIAAEDDFFALGGHSLLGMLVLSRIRQRFGVELPVRSLFEARTPAALAARIDAARGEPVIPQPPLRPARRDEPIPLSFAQQRLWFLHQMEPASPFYNIPAAVRLSGALDAEALRRALGEIVRRHEALRTSFRESPRGAVQVVHPWTGLFELPVHDVSHLPRERAEAEARAIAGAEAARPFDVTRDVLLRAALVRIAADAHLLVLDLHHVAGDGWSIGLLFRELAAAYAAFAAGEVPHLPELPVQYADFAVWQREWLRDEVLQAQLAYWRRRLEGAPAVLELPADRPRPAVQSFRGAVLPFEVPEAVATRLREAARGADATLFMVLLAGFGLLVSRLSGRDDVVVGSPIAGRVRREVEGLIGFFVNTMALRTDLSGDPAVAELVGRVRETTLEAYAHQDLPFERVVEELQPERTLSRNPLFQVAFALQNVAMEPVDAPGLRLSLEDVDSGTSKFDLFLEMREEGGRLLGNLEYATDLWERDSAERMIALFLRMLEGMAGDARTPVSLLARADAAAREVEVRAWNRTARPYPGETTIHARFAEVAAAHPDAVAVAWEGGAATYAELDARANRIANRLVAMGVRADQPVALLAERSPELVAAILGILKAGGAYVAIPPKYPRGRVAMMLADCGARVAIAEARFAEVPGDVAVLRLDAAEVAREAETAPEVSVSPHNAAYVVYTSGSTGRPKGVVVPHRAVLRLAVGNDFAETGAGETWLQLAPVAFDASTLELWAPLLNGGRIAQYPATAPDPAELGAFIRRHGVTSAWLTAGLFHQLVDAAPDALAGLHQLLAGGDVLSAPHVRRVLRAQPRLRLINGYGPTENTTFSCCRTIVAADVERASIPIGSPIANSTAYVLDRWMEPVPADVPGELFVGGDGLARGYLGAPRLTAERYLPHPFSAEAGARLYRTGDRVRRRPDGTIEFLGRIDEQVKIRGYRVEPGEVEAVLERSPVVTRAAVVVREDEPGDKRLVAYVVPSRHAAAADDGEETAGKQVRQWEALFDDVYTGTRGTEEGDETFDIVGWNSSYIGQPIPAEEMREWVDATVARIAGLRPRRVLELGVGTGLLLFRIAPKADEYVGTDISAQVLRRLEARLEDSPRRLPPVRLLQREAADFAGVGGGFDTAVLNSVSQYFPSGYYLVRVIEQAADALADGGAFFIGDVRSRRTLDAFRTAIELEAAADGASSRELRLRARRIVEEEEELVVDPDFFRALGRRIPRIAGVEVRVKRGRHHNELTRHRFDVVLRIGPDRERPVARPVAWDAVGSISHLHDLLREGDGEPLAVLGIPDARLWRELRAVEVLEMEDAPETAGEVRALLDAEPSPAIDPEALWALGDGLGMAVEIRPAERLQPGRIDALFRRPDSDAAFLAQAPAEGEPAAYANDPLRALQARELAPRVRAWLKEQLPEHMVPAAVVVMDAFPLTPNGKVDRRALPAPEPARPAGAGAEPATETEQRLAEIWREVLRVDRVWADDNFFDLGGHSLLATQLATRVREGFGIRLPLQRVFEAPTVSALAAVVDAARDEMLASLIDELEGLSDDEVRALLEAAEGALGSAAGD